MYVSGQRGLLHNLCLKAQVRKNRLKWSNINVARNMRISALVQDAIDSHAQVWILLPRTSTFLASLDSLTCTLNSERIHVHAGEPGGNKHLLCTKALLETSYVDSSLKELQLHSNSSTSSKESRLNPFLSVNEEQKPLLEQGGSEFNNSASASPSCAVAKGDVGEAYAYAGETGRRKSCPRCRHVVCTCKGLKERRKQQQWLEAGTWYARVKAWRSEESRSVLWSLFF